MDCWEESFLGKALNPRTKTCSCSPLEVLQSSQFHQPTCTFKWGGEPVYSRGPLEVLWRFSGGTRKPVSIRLYWSKSYLQKASDAGDISPPIFWIFRQILGWACGTHKVSTVFRDSNTNCLPIMFNNCLNLIKSHTSIIYCVRKLLFCHQIHYIFMINTLFCKILSSWYTHFSANFSML